MESFIVKTTSVDNATHNGAPLPRSVTAQNAGHAARIVADEHIHIAPGPSRIELTVEGKEVTSTFVARSVFKGVAADDNEDWVVVERSP